MKISFLVQLWNSKRILCSDKDDAPSTSSTKTHYEYLKEKLSIKKKITAYNKDNPFNSKDNLVNNKDNPFNNKDNLVNNKKTTLNKEDNLFNVELSSNLFVYFDSQDIELVCLPAPTDNQKNFNSLNNVDDSNPETSVAISKFLEISK